MHAIGIFVYIAIVVATDVFIKKKIKQVRCIKWSPDDSHLLSCSMDGAVYDWSVQACKREREYILKSCSYTSLAFTADLKTTFAVGSDRTLNQINLQDSSVSCSFEPS